MPDDPPSRSGLAGGPAQAPGTLSILRTLPSLALLLSVSGTAFASDAALVVIPALNLAAVAIVMLLGLVLRAGWRTWALASACAIAACAILWVLPNALLPPYQWLGLFQIFTAFFPPLIAGGAILWRSRRAKTAHNDG